MSIKDRLDHLAPSMQSRIARTGEAKVPPCPPHSHDLYLAKLPNFGHEDQGEPHCVAVSISMTKVSLSCLL